MSGNTRTIQEALNDAVKKRDQLRMDKTNKINKISAYFDSKIRKYDLYIEMLSGEPSLKDKEIHIDINSKEQLPMPSIPRVPTALDTPTDRQVVASDKPTRAQTILSIFRKISKPLRVMEIMSELEKEGHKVEGSQPYGTVQNALLRNTEIFYKFPDRSWGLVEWKEKKQDHDKPKDGLGLI